MATVYLGRALGEAGFERLVAIKLMHPQYVDQAEFETMFFDEARLAARIRHPNVVGTLDVQKAPEGLFLVMDYVEGPTLAAVLREVRTQGQQLPIEIALRVTSDVLAGLQAAHELRGPDGELLGLVHRDVSPQNILVGGDGITRITDFGVARANVRASTTEDGKIKGKLGYMPPEQLAGGAIDARADVYAAAVVLWETLVGRKLFVGDDPGLIISCVLRGAMVPPGEERPEIPERVDRACMRALRIAPSTRFGSAAAFAEELENGARAAGVAMASPRDVGTFVRKLDAYVARIVPPDLAHHVDPPKDGMPPRSGRPPAGSTLGNANAVMSQVAKARSGRPWILPLVAVGVLGGIGVGVVLGRGAGTAHGSGDARSTASADLGAASQSAAPAASARSATTSSAAGSSDHPSENHDADAGSGAAAVGSASGVASGAARPEATPGHPGGPAGPALGAKLPKPKVGSDDPNSFQPQGL
jgi:eukaryotic-like serine/threonine-protein kinase